MIPNVDLLVYSDNYSGIRLKRVSIIRTVLLATDGSYVELL